MAQPQKEQLMLVLQRIALPKVAPQQACLVQGVALNLNRWTSANDAARNLATPARLTPTDTIAPASTAGTTPTRLNAPTVAVRSTPWMNTRPTLNSLP